MRRLWIVALATVALLFSSGAAIASPQLTHHGGKKSVALTAGVIGGIVQYGGVGNPDGLVNAKACNPEAPAFYQVTTYTSGEGYVRPLDRFHVEFAHCNSETGPVSGQIALVTAKGVLYGEYTGTYGQLEDDPITLTVTFMQKNTQAKCYLLDHTKCHSTGTFAHAAGTATMSAWAVPSLALTGEDDPNAFIPWHFRAVFSGDLSY